VQGSWHFSVTHASLSLHSSSDVHSGFGAETKLIMQSCLIGTYALHAAAIPTIGTTQLSYLLPKFIATSCCCFYKL
jgi:hypothetical protein